MLSFRVLLTQFLFDEAPAGVKEHVDVQLDDVATRLANSKKMKIGLKFVRILARIFEKWQNQAVLQIFFVQLVSEKVKKEALQMKK